MPYRSESLYKLSVVDRSATISIKYSEDCIELRFVSRELWVEHSIDEIVSVDCTIFILYLLSEEVCDSGLLSFNEG